MKNFLLGFSVAALPGIFIYFAGVARWKSWTWFMPGLRDELEKLRLLVKRMGNRV